MPAQLFTQHYDPRDVDISTLVGQIGHLGVLCLIVLERMFPEPVKASRLAFMLKVKDVRKTLDPMLAGIATYGFAEHTGSRRSETWRITDFGRQSISPLIASTGTSIARLPSRAQLPLPIAGGVDNSPEIVDNSAGESLRPPRSSSSDLIRSIDQIDRIDPEEERTRGENLRIGQVGALLDRRGITGDKRRAVLAAPWATYERVADWFRHVDHLEQSGFKFRRSKAAYALACILHEDEPPGGEDILAAGPDLPANSPADDRPIVPPLAADSYAARLLWPAARGELEMQMNRASFDVWIKPLYVSAFGAGQLTLVAPSDQAQAWLQQHLDETLRRILSGITGRPVAVQIVVGRPE